jgi:membrane protease YdiL (CAAX protease family)
MGIKEKIKEELIQVGTVTLYFLFCFGMILLLKKLFLAEYDVGFYALSAAVLGALVVGKVVVILDHTKIGNRFEEKPPYVDIIYRSLTYTFAVAIVLIIEHIFHALGDSKSLWAAIKEVIANREAPKLWAIIICIFGSFAVYNVISTINKRLGEGKLKRILFSSKK